MKMRLCAHMNTVHKIRRVRVFQQKCLRTILRMFYPNLVRNEVVLERTEQKDIAEDIVSRKWRWIGHIMRRKDNHLTMQAIKWHITGRRNRGRPRDTWCRVMKCEFEAAHGKYSFRRVERLAQDRSQWKIPVDAVRAAKAHRE